MENYKHIKRIGAGVCACLLAFTLLAQSGYSDINSVSADEQSQNLADIESAKDKIAELEKKQAQLDEKINSTKDDISAEEENQEAIREQIDTINETLEMLDSSIVELTTQIEKLQGEIKATQGIIEEKKNQIDSGVNDFKLRLRAMYLAGSDSYTEILLGANDFYDMLMKIELVKRVADHDNDMIDSLVRLKDEYEAEMTALQTQQNDLQATESELKSQRDTKEKQKDKLSDLYTQSKEIIAQLEAEQANFEANKDSIEAEHSEFEDELQALYKKEEERKAEEERKKAEEAENQNSNNNSNDNSSSNDSTINTSTGFMWPVPGHYGITSYMGWRWGAYHKGIDISDYGVRGASVVASQGGTVIQACNDCTHDYGKNSSCGCGGGYGNYVVIDHGNGYWTLYGHMQYTTVSVGDTVTQGQTIGVVGTTGYSTGDHLHFEVRLNGEAVNPMNYI